VFAAPSCDNTTTDIFVGSTDGSPPVALTSTPDHEEIYPRWSPDHRSIAFLRDSILHVMNADGTQVRDLGVKVGPLAPPSWNPDGTKLVYAHEPPPCFHEESYGNYCASELRTYDVVTGSDTLFRRGTLLTEPEWLRTGEVVAFSSCLVENCPGNWTAMSETSLGGLYTGLPPYPTYRSYLAGHGVTVSADNRRLALVVSEPWDIWTYEQPGPLYTCFLSTCENYVPELDTRLPRWSPGGERLAYVRDDGIWVTPVAKGVPAVPSHVYAASRVRGLDW
jgi:Tol biopolymer transport system component